MEILLFLYLFFIDSSITEIDHRINEDHNKIDYVKKDDVGYVMAGNLASYPTSITKKNET